MRVAGGDDEGVGDAEVALRGLLVDELGLGEVELEARLEDRCATAAATTSFPSAIGNGSGPGNVGRSSNGSRIFKYHVSSGAIRKKGSGWRSTFHMRCCHLGVLTYLEAVWKMVSPQS